MNIMNTIASRKTEKTELNNLKGIFSQIRWDIKYNW
jgi:hypothetical protein